MKLTNRFNLPQPFVDAVEEDLYDRGDATRTTTELTTPIRISAFRAKFWDQITEDVSERLWALSGQAKHVVLERIARRNPERYIVETRFACPLPGITETVSGRIDLYDNFTRTLFDWKETSVWKFMLGDTKDWEGQGNINTYIMRYCGYTVDRLAYIAMLKDWKARKARLTKQGDYPECPVRVRRMPIWSAGQQQEYILERMQVYREEMENPPVCTERERWQRNAALAVMKKGRKSAIRVLQEHQQAYAMLRHYEERAKPGEKFYIEERPNEPVRCLDHCPVRAFCDFGIAAKEKWREETNGKEEEES